MDDRRLLELAAKAAGIITKYPVSNSGVIIGFSGDQWGGGPDFWNPLRNDGDALRLAVKLNLTIHMETESAGVVCAQWGIDPCECEGSVIQDAPVGSDAYAATRRAIVRAAATIANSHPPAYL